MSLLGRIFTPVPSGLPEQIQNIPLKISARAKRMALRYDRAAAQIVLTWPQKRRATKQALAEAERFIASNALWIKKQNVRHKAAGLTSGDLVTLAGERKIFLHAPGRGVSQVTQDQVRITGDARHFAARAARLFKAEAEKAFLPILREKEKQLNLRGAHLTVRDPKTRWGSCSSQARVMLSWRLLLAPPAVMDYVIAHEVAHRVHMNHGKRFWALCQDLSVDAPYARQWLKKEGPALLSLRIIAP